MGHPWASLGIPGSLGICLDGPRAVCQGAAAGGTNTSNPGGLGRKGQSRFIESVDGAQLTERLRFRLFSFPIPGPHHTICHPPQTTTSARNSWHTVASVSRSLPRWLFPRFNTLASPHFSRPQIPHTNLSHIIIHIHIRTPTQTHPRCSPRSSPPRLLLRWSLPRPSPSVTPPSAVSSLVSPGRSNQYFSD